MNKYMMLTLTVLVAGLLNGCFPDEEAQIRNLGKAKVEVELTNIKLDIARAKRDDKVATTNRISEFKLNRINNIIEADAIDHEMILALKKVEADFRKLASESGVILTDDFWVWFQGKLMPGVNYNAADSLLRKLKKERVKLAKDAPILVASFVNLDDLSESSTFGRVVSEQIASRLKQKGYATIEMKLRSNVFIKEGSGEFVLSREVAEISAKHRASAVVAGTYAVASTKIYLTARVINVSDGRVLASHDYNVPISRDTFKLLLKGKEKAKPGWL